jgi:hypothetical protein
VEGSVDGTSFPAFSRIQLLYDILGHIVNFHDLKCNTYLKYRNVLLQICTCFNIIYTQNHMSLSFTPKHLRILI